MELKTLLRKIPGIMSVTGYTKKGSQELKKMIGEYFDESFMDAVGNQVFVRRCGKKDAPKILIDTHFDEVGMIVTDIKDGGFVTMANIGGLDMRIMQAAEVVIYGEEKEIYGVIVSTPPHLTKQGEARKLKQITDLYIDTGYSKEELEKYIHIGSPIGYRPIYRDLLNNKISGKGFDCKSCSACAVDAIINTEKKDLAGDIYLQFSVFEETGSYMGGATVSTYNVDPDYAMVADVTFAVMPEDKNSQPKMGKGVSMTLSPITNRKLCKMLAKEAKEKGLELQNEIVARHTGTNTMVVNLANEGVPTVDIGLPLKNMHTYNEIISVDDAKDLSTLIKIFITSKEIAEVFTR